MTVNQDPTFPPTTSELVYIPVSQGAEKWQLTWVDELLETTVNNCFKVSDKNGRHWIVERYKKKDKATARAWKALSQAAKP